MLRDCEGSDVDEKIRRLPAGGETWDKKVKRKRSVGPLGRPSDEGEPKRAMHYKLNNDPGSTSSDAQNFRWFIFCNMLVPPFLLPLMLLLFNLMLMQWPH